MYYVHEWAEVDPDTLFDLEPDFDDGEDSYLPICGACGTACEADDTVCACGAAIYATGCMYYFTD